MYLFIYMYIHVYIYIYTFSLKISKNTKSVTRHLKCSYICKSELDL